MAPPSSASPRDLPDAVIKYLSGDQRIEACPPDPAYAVGIVERIVAEEVEDALHAAAQGRWRKANTYSYDGARKAVEAWLLARGWRVRATTGAHAAVVDIVGRWLSAGPDPGPRIARSFGAARKARHDDVYPSPMAPERTARELRALALDNARLINEVRRAFGLDVLEAIVPSDPVLEARPER